MGIGDKFLKKECGLKERAGPPFCHLSHLQCDDWRPAEIQGHRMASSCHGGPGHIH